jgi:N utilization substance protein A
MNAEFIEALNAIEKERGINKEILIDAVENALISAYRRNYGTSNNVRAEVDRETGEIQLFASKSVVETVENPHSEIALENARKINVLYEVGDVLEEEVKPKNFGRIAAQTAKQVVVQRIREAERGVIYEEYVEKENEVLTAIVQRVEKSGAYVELGKTDGLLAPNEMIPGESFESNDRIKVYVLEVRKTNKGPQVLVSRTHPGLVKRLFELEVPEIQSGIVQIKSIAREAGFRTKVAVPPTISRSIPWAPAWASVVFAWNASWRSCITRKLISLNGIPTLRCTSQRRSARQGIDGIYQRN